MHFQLEVEFVELSLVDGRGGFIHHVASRVIFREGDSVTNAVKSSYDRNETVEAKCEPSVRWSTILESAHKEAELLLSLFGSESKKLKHFVLKFRVVNTD